jgi:hypothetical protein
MISTPETNKLLIAEELNIGNDRESVAHLLSDGSSETDEIKEMLKLIDEDITYELQYLFSQTTVESMSKSPQDLMTIDNNLLSRLTTELERHLSDLPSIEGMWRWAEQSFSAEELKCLRQYRIQELTKAQQDIRFKLEELAKLQTKEIKPRKFLPMHPIAVNGQLSVASDRINKATVEALMPGAMKQSSVLDVALNKLKVHGLTIGKKFWAAYPFSARKDLHGAIGFTQNPGEAIWRMLQRNGALAVKAQYALWARAYAETDADPQKFIIMSISQFCDDLGFKKKKGAHERFNKHKAVEVLDLLTSLELSAIYQTPKYKIVHLSGPLWMRGGIREELDDFTDIFGERHVGDPQNRMSWDPIAFAYAPGIFFANPEWRKYNHNVALIGAGLLQLGSGDNDKWAVMVGGYIALLARMNGYRTTRVGVKRVLERTGLLAEMMKHRQASRMRDKLERALEKLQLVRVIKAYHFTSEAEDVDFDDLNNLETLDRMSEPHRWAASWLNQCIVIEWPEDFERRAEELREKKRQKFIAAKSKRRRVKPRNSTTLLPGSSLDPV